MQLPIGPGRRRPRWWSPINTPILGPDGQVKYIIHRVEDVTAFIREHASGTRPESGKATAREALEAELYSRARELQRLNEELRRAHTRERQVALTLQEAMLQSPDLARHDEIAVRYRPATGMLNVCGDWYDMVDLNEGRFSVAVGDVVGHGLQAAAVMGMLRGALSAAMRALGRPAQALELLSLYSRTIDGALNTTSTPATACSSTATPGIPLRSWPTRTAPATSWIKRSNLRSAPVPRTSPSPRHRVRTHPGTPWCSNPTG